MSKKMNNVVVLFAKLQKIAEDMLLDLTENQGFDYSLASMLVVVELTDIVCTVYPKADHDMQERFVQRVIDFVGL